MPSQSCGSLPRKSESSAEREAFLVRYNPDTQGEVCRNAEDCFFGKHPTLATINATYGPNTAAMWLVPQLYNLSEYCGCKDKLTGGVLKECASIIADEFFYLRVTEVMLFFRRFKAGRYGRFYGSIDPLVIMTSLREFLRERNDAYRAREQEERKRQEAESRKKAISWEEYSKKRYGEVRSSPLDR